MKDDGRLPGDLHVEVALTITSDAGILGDRMAHAARDEQLAGSRDIAEERQLERAEQLVEQLCGEAMVSLKKQLFDQHHEANKRRRGQNDLAEAREAARQGGDST